jgi:hypothetical protein
VVSLLAATTQPPRPAGIPLPADGLSALHSLLSWPANLRFPALDLLRVVSLYSPPELWVLDSLANELSATGKDGETNSLLALRAMTNSFCTRKGEAALKSAFSTIFPSFRRHKNLLNKNGKVALASVVLKYVLCSFACCEAEVVPSYSILAVQRDLDKSAGGLMVDLVLEVSRVPCREKCLSPRSFWKIKIRRSFTARCSQPEIW